MTLLPPLAGVRIIELAGIGPGPFCGMMLADNGAEVIRIDRPQGLQAGIEIDDRKDVLLRSRRTISLDLKSPAAKAIIRRLAATADGFMEGFRPGVVERLGLGPAEMMAINPKLVYGRMTGWGQDGPYATLPGHDINYIAVSGILDSIGRRDQPPVPPLNLLGDYGGGGMLLAFGMVSAILAARSGAPGRMIDCAMVEGASALMSGIWTLRNSNQWADGRGANLLDGGAPFYDTYRTSDDRHVAIGAIETKFFDRLRMLLGFADDPDFADQHDRRVWPAMRRKLGDCFGSQPLDHWCRLLEREEVCFSPVIPMDEAPHHPHNDARQNFMEIDGMVQPRPVPRYSETAPVAPRMWRENNDRIGLLDELGFAPDEVESLQRDGAFGPA